MKSHNLKALFLLKKNSNGYGNSSYSSTGSGKAGLSNSAAFTSQALHHFFHIHTKLEVCVDANSIDKEVHNYKPDICFIEAIWVTGPKMEEIAKLHKKVLFVIRVHSKTTFLANEGIAIDRIKAYNKIPNVLVAFNNKDTNDEFQAIGIDSVYLPNIYRNTHCIFIKEETLLERLLDFFIGVRRRFWKEKIDIGCFGAIRPMKNHLLQAMAAIQYGEENDKIIHFHVNGTRVEQKGDNVLKNLRSLFENSRHKLIEHGWLEHEDFLKLIKQMDIGLQVSLSESFNIVTADFISQAVPIIVSSEIEWCDKECQVNPSDGAKIAKKIKEFVDYPNPLIRKNLRELNNYNNRALAIWGEFLESF